MTSLFSGETANDVWRKAAERFRDDSEIETQNSQHGPTRELLHVCFSIHNPLNRFVVAREPAINPAFALAEVIWIINGSNKSDFLNYWNSELPEFSGHGDIYYGAYGHRIRVNFGIDQMQRALNALQSKPDSRQVLLTIWDPNRDLPRQDGEPVDRDIPCNIVSMLKVRGNALHWTQIMRSNDLFLGTPYNFIQFTYLQEILAGWLGVDIGPYHHFSDSLHVYTDKLENMGAIHPGEPALNSDSIGLPKDESDRANATVYSRIETLTSPGLTPSNLMELAFDVSLCTAYKNILLVMAAETARRRGWSTMVSELMDNCTNPVFIQLWNRWFERFT